jgi:hypothetical protein
MDYNNVEYRDISKLSLEETVSYVNELLSTGHSTATVERALNLGKDTLRKRFSRGGFKYHKETNSYVLATAIEGADPKALGTATVQQPKKVSTNKTKQQTKQTSLLSVEEVEELRKLVGLRADLEAFLRAKKAPISNHKEVYSKDIYSEFKGVLQGTTMQLYHEVWEALDSFVDIHKVSKKVVVNQAIWDFIQRYGGADGDKNTDNQG